VTAGWLVTSTGENYLITAAIESGINCYLLLAGDD